MRSVSLSAVIRAKREKYDKHIGYPRLFVTELRMAFLPSFLWSLKCTDNRTSLLHTCEKEGGAQAAWLGKKYLTSKWSRANERDKLDGLNTETKPRCQGDGQSSRFVRSSQWGNALERKVIKTHRAWNSLLYGLLVSSVRPLGAAERKMGRAACSTDLTEHTGRAKYFKLLVCSPTAAEGTYEMLNLPKCKKGRWRSSPTAAQLSQHAGLERSWQHTGTWISSPGRETEQPAALTCSQQLWFCL